MARFFGMQKVTSPSNQAVVRMPVSKTIPDCLFMFFSASFYCREECQEQVHRYPNAKFRKFSTYDNAWSYVDRDEEDSSYTSNYSSKHRRRDTSSTVVYTDGCCTRNGQYEARGGIGVYWGPNHPLNVSERLEGRQTNQRAELEAASRAVEQARAQNVPRLQVCTDSKFTTDGMNKWVHSWKQNGWRAYNGGEVVNKESFQKLDSLCKGMDVTFESSSSAQF
ncbi:ribonuclease H1 isoform X2 [Pelobates cultripes]|uniref:Ribonuclease H1 isoform X2 n=1 Tax=Pelobates cultripes TaxID=61616 RepID=A0AAD1R9T9_PELCU|nr:ribonuclease H1 isoform X2 [Pelobates cultripes]